MPQYASVCGCSNGSPYTSLVLEIRNRAFTRFARPSMFSVPMKLVLAVLMGLYLRQPEFTLLARDDSNLLATSALRPQHCRLSHAFDGFKA